MIPREEAILNLKEHWKVNDFTFLGQIFIDEKSRENNDATASCYFKKIYWNKNIQIIDVKI